MSETVKPRKRATQLRTLQTQQQIVDGAIRVLAEQGVAGLTHRAVAQAAGVSLAATTRHFDSKASILSKVSERLLSDYLLDLRGLVARLSSKAGDPKRMTLAEVFLQVVITPLTKDRERSLAWWEVMLSGGRSADGRLLAHHWYAQLDEIWIELARDFEPERNLRRTRLQIDRALGMTLLLHPLLLNAEQIRAIDAGADLRQFFASDMPKQMPATDLSAKKAKMRADLVDAGIDLLISKGPGGLSHRALAEHLGMARSGPSYYYPSIDALVVDAQLGLFDRAKGRYRAGAKQFETQQLNTQGLSALTSKIFQREAEAFRAENLAYFTVWIAAARNSELRGFLQHVLLDQWEAWRHRLALQPQMQISRRAAFFLQSVFAGMLVRRLVSAEGTNTLSDLNSDFSEALDLI